MKAFRRLTGLRPYIGTGEDPQGRVAEGELVWGRLADPHTRELMEVHAIREATDVEVKAARVSKPGVRIAAAGPPSPTRNSPPGVPPDDPSLVRPRRRR
jgi:hypothetical protein